jgi:hypothetical protein
MNIPDTEPSYLKISDQMLKELREEDLGFDNRLIPKNFTESRFEHHVPPPKWAGPLQLEFGVHRRGPKAR